MDKRLVITFLITGLLAGLLLTWQISSKAPLPLNFPSDEVEARDELLKSFLDEEAYLQSKIVSLRKEAEEEQSKIQTRTETANFDLLDSLKRNIGLTEVHGAGIEITLDDSRQLSRAESEDVTDSNLIQASDLRDIINLLSASKAEAISVNNQRIIATSPISSVGTTILVNNSHIAPPFIISAVGDTNMMLQRILNKNLLPDLYQRRVKSKITFEIIKKAAITIGIYNANLKTNYLNLVKE